MARLNIRGFTMGGLLLVCLWLSVGSFTLKTPVDGDTFWHLRSGEVSLDQGPSILRVDPFSFTRAGSDWFNQSWLAQWIMTGMYRATGGRDRVFDTGVVGLTVFVSVLACTGLFFVWRMLRGPFFVRGAVLFLCLTTSDIFYTARPQMFSFALCAVAAWGWWRWRNGKAAPFWLVPLCVLWANVHGGWVMALIIGGGSVFGEGLVSLAAGRLRADGRRLGRAALVLVGCFLAVAVNPRGTAMWAYPFQTAGSVMLRTHVMEWMPPNFQGDGMWSFLVMLLLPFVLGVFLRKRAGLGLTDVLLMLGVGFMGLLYQRNVYFLPMVAAAPLCTVVGSFLEERGLRESTADLERPFRHGWGIVLFGVACVGIVFWFTVAPMTVASALKSYPLGAVDYIERVHPRGNLFSTYNWGGYLIFQARDYKVWIDSRSDLYGDSGMSEWLSIVNGDGWQAAFAKYDIHAALLDSSEPLFFVLRDSAHWRVAYADDAATVFVSNDS